MSAVRFRVVEIEVLPEIVIWVFENMDQGADLSGILGQQELWVTVPEICFSEFLDLWGRYVSAC